MSPTEIQERNIPFVPVMIAIFFGSVLATLGMSSISVAFPVLMEQFHTDLTTMQWTMTGYLLATGIVAPLTGYLGEKFSTKYLYVAALIGYTLISGLSAFAWNIESLIAFRVVQGIFGGIILPATMTILYQVIPRAKQAFALSMWTLSTMLSPAFGPLLAGWLIGKFEWKWLFLMDIPFGIAAVAVAWRLIPYYKLNTPKTFDLPGLITVILSSGSLLIAFSEAHSWGWSSWRTLSLLAFGILMLGCFIRRELMIPEPLLNLKVFVNLKYTVSLAVLAVITLNLYSGAYLIPVFLQNVQGASALEVGLILLPATLAMAGVMPLVGKLYMRIAPQWLIVSGILLIAVGTLAIGRLDVYVSQWYITLWLTIRYIGISLTIMPLTNVGMEAIPRELSGHASSVNNWIRQVFGSFSIALFTSLIASRLTAHNQALGLDRAAEAQRKLLKAEAFMMSSNDVYIVATMIVLVGLPLVWTLFRGKSRNKRLVNHKLQHMKNLTQKEQLK
ncbi:EmrB/QacA subfamily drug resistance transporter [Paenibacillus sp. V4I9]|uniref:DHA2 family efflux MFS transporter permease subunit n=1 Tax=Paenibacillus sp. V4I9 TaxID=3042308 RepID=UPI0027877A95|nr:DHA2 family efflux MFS transporter permease subunit [Paenibacillus sp. V4I9]MDQ0891109.1 EmrB/QacA subfamily drug resistance transporter [Paenibacillus sp. V4I9]